LIFLIISKLANVYNIKGELESPNYFDISKNG